MKIKKLGLVWSMIILLILTGCSSIQKIAEFNLDHLVVENENVKQEYKTLPESTYIKDTLELAMENTTTFNPLDGVSYSVDQGLKLIYESLFAPNQENILQPILVEEIIPISDTVYRFALKENVYFHTGDVLTAEDVFFSYQYLQQRSESGYRYADTYIQSINVEDNYHFSVEFKEVNRYNLYALTFPILSRAYVQSKEYNPMLPIGTGPYQYDFLKNRMELILKQNTNYYGSKGNIPYIRFTFISQFKEEYNMFLSKRIDMIAPRLTEWPNYSDDQNIYKITYTSPYYYYIGFNHNKLEFQSRSTRQYYNQIMNSASLQYKIFLGHLVLTPLPLNLELPIQKQVKTYSFDNATPLNKPVMTQDRQLRFIYLTEDQHQVKWVQGMVEMLGEEAQYFEFIGMEPEAYNQALLSGAFDMYLCKYQTGFIPSLEEILGSQGKYNYGNYSNPNFDANLVQALQQMDDAEYIHKLNELSQWVITEVPIIPIGFVENGIFIYKQLEGQFTPNYFYLYQDIHQIRITDR